jgi:tRNA U34 5-carboxymethylaminomethyl modifying GTPase MnmE/TrmE
MNRAMLEDHLAASERHLAEVQRYVAHQRELVVQLKREGHDTAQDTRLLEQYEEVLAMHVDDRNRLRRQLGQEIGLQERWDQNEGNISEAKRHIKRLRELMDELQRGSDELQRGNDLRLATNMLKQFEQRLAAYIGERDRLQKELGLRDWRP